MPETNETQITELLGYAEQLQSQVEQLQKANSQLVAVNAELQRQVQQYADPLISFGEGVLRVILNARSIKGMSLRELAEVNSQGDPEYKGMYRLMIDDLPVTPFLQPDQVERELLQAERIWRQALQPPD